MDADRHTAGQGPSVLVIEKSLPHGIFVTRDGGRFVNEAANYNDVGIAMYDTEEGGRSGRCRRGGSSTPRTASGSSSARSAPAR